MSALTKTEKPHDLNPRTKSYEFLGPPGAFLVSTLVPFFTYLFATQCSERAGGCPASFSELPSLFVPTVTDPDWWKSLIDKEAFIAYFGWYAFTVVAWAVLPGDWVEGLSMRDGGKKKYKINAFATMLAALGIVAGLIINRGPSSFTFIYEHWIGLVTAAYAMSLFQAFYVYIASFYGGRLLALGGNSGNHLYDWFIGRELNPSIGSFDIKSFNELRPGLILWFLIDISMACEQAVRRGGQITDSMALVLAFQGWYVADALYNEPAILSTMDITTDGFGFMLSVGDLLWVPFTYSLQARYLAWNHVELGPVWTAVIFILHGLGYWIFRSANGEKNDFRNGKNPKNLLYMETQRGTKLLTTGWWGVCRHPNYLGDLIMALTWSLPTGFNTPITYFYPIYFTILLVHRQYRDDEQCSIKYGEDWETYKKLVPYRIFPGIF